MLFACVGRLGEPHPTLDIGSSSIQHVCWSYLAAMLAPCLFLMSMHDLCMLRDAWPLWQPCLGLLGSFQVTCSFLQVLSFISMHALFFICSLALYACYACFCLLWHVYSSLHAYRWGLELDSPLAQVGLHSTGIGRRRLQRPTLDAAVSSV